VFDPRNQKGNVVASSDRAHGKMKRTTGMLTVYGKGKKAGGRTEIKRQAILKKRKILEEGRREMENTALERQEMGRC
jgi:hypothetical protein